jgi:3-methyladenine DNA glycosylase AlkD
MLDDIRRAVREQASSRRARDLARFFRTGPGEYGEGDRFLGVTVPQIRRIVRAYPDLSHKELSTLLLSEFHEERLCALLILVRQFERGDARTREAVYRYYLANLDRVNSWDLVDLSAPNIVGEYLAMSHGSGAVLERLAQSASLWERRIAILATAAFIRRGRHVPTFNIARMLLNDDHDLIHKAVGWMLREVGKRCGQEVEEDFLRRHYRRMPRTMLRYAIERFPKRLRLAYLNATI